MLSGAKNKIDSNEKELEQEESQFKRTFYGSSTGALARHLFGFLKPKDRALLSQTCVDAHRLEKVDKALTCLDFRIELMENILKGFEGPAFQDDASIWRNPSGFLRLKDAIKFVDPKLLAQLPSVYNVRLNFWPGEAYADLGAAFEAETKHSHPRGFCSFIVSGGYEHRLYSAGADASTSFDVVKVAFPGGNKTFDLQEQKRKLSTPIKEQVLMNEAGYAYFSTNLIHEVVGRVKEDPSVLDRGTLSINIVFNPSANQSLSYNLFLTDYSKDKIVEDYVNIGAEQAKKTLIVVKELLQENIENLKALKELRDSAENQEGLNRNGYKCS